MFLDIILGLAALLAALIAIFPASECDEERQGCVRSTGSWENGRQLHASPGRTSPIPSRASGRPIGNIHKVSDMPIPATTKPTPSNRTAVHFAKHIIDWHTLFLVVIAFSPVNLEVHYVIWVTLETGDPYRNSEGRRGTALKRKRRLN